MKDFLAALGAVVLVLVCAAAVGVLIGAVWPLKDDNELDGRGG